MSESTPTIAYGATILGVEARLVTIEVDLLRRLPAVVIVGLPAATVREAAERVRSAIQAHGLEFPRARVVVSLSPADLRKDGTSFDLPIAVAVLQAMGVVARDDRFLYFGELSLSGAIRPCRGVLAAAELAEREGKTLVCGARDATVARAYGHDVVRIHDLSDIQTGAPQAQLDSGDLTECAQWASDNPAAPSMLDYADVRGNLHAVEAFVEAAATGRPLLLVGPPGCGKTMLAARFPRLLPDLGSTERLEVAGIHDVAGILHAGPWDLLPPFRAPHHTVSAAGLVGSASMRPGEASLAHAGVLFLDEFPEFPRHTLDSLRPAAEDGRIRAVYGGHYMLDLPARFHLIAASNPCACGFHGHPTRVCTCPPSIIEGYAKRLAHPLLKNAIRVDLQPASPLTDTPWPSTEELRARVEARKAELTHNAPTAQA